MIDCTQQAMLRCMHVLSITGYRTNNNELKRPASLRSRSSPVKQVTKRKLVLKVIMSLSHTMQKSSHAADDLFPISTAECIGLMLNPKNQR